jgi:hypothetical protein
MVKKIHQDGSECKKCKEVNDRLNENNEMQFIDHIAYAEEGNTNSEGYQIAQKHGVSIAPFFVVSEEGKETVYKTYLQLRKQVFNKQPDEKDKEIEEKRQSKDDEMYYM